MSDKQDVQSGSYEKKSFQMVYQDYGPTPLQMTEKTMSAGPQQETPKLIVSPSQSSDQPDELLQHWRFKREFQHAPMDTRNESRLTEGDENIEDELRDTVLSFKKQRSIIRSLKKVQDQN